MKESIYNYVKKVKIKTNGKVLYKVIKTKSYYSVRYLKYITISTNDGLYDGATCAFDIDSFGWLYHDVLKRDKRFRDGTVCTNHQASMVLYDLLKSEGRWFRARSWYLSTLAWGTFVK